MLPLFYFYVKILHRKSYAEIKRGNKTQNTNVIVNTSDREKQLKIKLTKVSEDGI